jgi:hypothetical protein
MTEPCTGCGVEDGGARHGAEKHRDDAGRWVEVIGDAEGLCGICARTRREQRGAHDLFANLTPEAGPDYAETPEEEADRLTGGAS